MIAKRKKLTCSVFHSYRKTIVGTALIPFPFERKAYSKLEHKKKLTEQKYEGILKLLHENHYSTDMYVTRY